MRREEGLSTDLPNFDLRVLFTTQSWVSKYKAFML